MICDCKVVVKAYAIRKKIAEKKKEKKKVRIALTNMSYKSFMSLVKNEIEEHLEENRELKKHKQGSQWEWRTEDIIFMLQYIVEETYKMKKSLIVISVDVKKAYDSIKREIS